MVADAANRVVRCKGAEPAPPNVANPVIVTSWTPVPVKSWTESPMLRFSSLATRRSITMSPASTGADPSTSANGFSSWLSIHAMPTSEAAPLPSATPLQTSLANPDVTAALSATPGVDLMMFSASSGSGCRVGVEPSSGPPSSSAMMVPSTTASRPALAAAMSSAAVPSIEADRISVAVRNATDKTTASAVSANRERCAIALLSASRNIGITCRTT